MSSYKRETKHPVTGKWEEAVWLDDYYGPHHYGVLFPDGKAFDPEELKLETRLEIGGKHIKPDNS